MDTASLQCRMADLAMRVQRLAAESRCADLVAAVQPHNSTAASGASEPLHDDWLDSGIPVMKRGWGGRRLGSSNHRQAWGVRSGPATVRNRHATSAVRHQTTVGGRTLHYAVSEPGSNLLTAGRQYERKEWHRAAQAPIPQHSDGGPQHSDLDRYAKRDVVQPTSFRQACPPPGALPCDSEIDPSALAASLPEDVLSMIRAYHEDAHRAVKAEQDEAEKLAARKRAARASRDVAKEVHERRVREARRMQLRRERQQRRMGHEGSQWLRAG